MSIVNLQIREVLVESLLRYCTAKTKTSEVERACQKWRGGGARRSLSWGGLLLYTFILNASGIGY